MKAKYKKIIAITSLTIVILLVGSPFVLMEYLMYRLDGTRLAKISIEDSKSQYVVVYSRGAWQGYTLCFGVVDENKSESNLTILGPVYYADMPLNLESVVISSDGSVVAAQSDIGIVKGCKTYWLAYDFDNSICYGEGIYRINQDPNLILARNNAIHELLQSRGGIAKEFSKDNISEKLNKLSYWEHKRWEKQEKKAKENCKPWAPSDANTLPN